ncbi:MAG: hypothetical protein IJJ66_10490 [Treponema sp.]|nr:hypothetical protein [Treponema sp.]
MTVFFILLRSPPFSKEKIPPPAYLFLANKYLAMEGELAAYGGIFLGRTPPCRGQPQGWLRKQWSRKAEPRNGGGAKGLAVELARKCLVEPLGLPSKKKKSTKNRKKCTFLAQNSV